jgi:[acyl-carrier-protein] S-malonyltransferase
MGLKKIAYIFPGQGAQYPGMVKDFHQNFSKARAILEEADDILGKKISKIILEGPEDTLTETQNSQIAIYVTSLAMCAVLEELFPAIRPSVCSGLSLGEYTALAASGRISFADGLRLVNSRAQYMNDACEKFKGTMAVILGLDAPAVEKLVANLKMPNDLWVANFNCPGQVVISGTLKGIEAGTEAAKAHGAKRVLSLAVHGAFHSGLMKEAEERLTEHVMNAPLKDSSIGLVMNVTGRFVQDLGELRSNLLQQVTGSVRWEQGVRSMCDQGVDLFIEIGPGKTLSGFNRKIGVTAETRNIEKITDLDAIGIE